MTDGVTVTSSGWYLGSALHKGGCEARKQSVSCEFSNCRCWSFPLGRCTQTRRICVSGQFETGHSTNFFNWLNPLTECLRLFALFLLPLLLTPLILVCTALDLSSAPSSGGSGLSGTKEKSHSGAVRREVKEASVVDAGGSERGPRTGNRGIWPYRRKLAFVKEPWRRSPLFGCSWCASFCHRPHRR